jgi:3-(3-hydroxy-phenyl)propionate hydroxylase
VPSADEFDLLIVGAGPVGLALANALAPSGLRMLIVEQEPGVATLPRAVSIDDEAMRLMQRLGLLDRARAVSVPGTGTRYYDRHGHPLFHAGSGAATSHGHPVKNPIDHSELQQVLWDGLDRFERVTLWPSCQLTSIGIVGDGVEVELRRADGSTIGLDVGRAVGCDGGRSTVRKALGVQMVGSSSSERWLVVDLVNDPHSERYAMHFGSPTRPHVIVPGRDGRCRYEFLLEPDEDPDEQGLRELAFDLLASHRGPVAPDDVVRCVIYTFNSLVADEWTRGPITLAGDAAHMMPPFAGQGLNSGFRDVANLAWKLDLVLRGLAGPALLQTYEEERRPHVEAMLALSRRMGEVMMTRSVLRTRMRDTLVHLAERLPSTRRFLREMRFRPPSELRSGFLAPGSAVVGVPLVQAPVLGEDGGTRPSDDVLGTGFALLAVDVDEAALELLTQPTWSELDARRVHLRVGGLQPLRSESWRGIAVEGGALAEQLADLSGKVLLIRPDRFIAAAFAPGEAGGAEAALGLSPGGKYAPVASPSGTSRVPRQIQ